MGMQSFLIVQTVLEWIALAAGAISFGYLVSAIVGWSSPHRKPRLVRLGLFLAVIPMCFVGHVVLLYGFLYPELRRQSDAEIEAAYDAKSVVRLHDEAPIFSTPLLSGNEFKLEEHHGKVVLLNFFATDCENCRKEFPILETLWERYGDNQNFAMVAIGRDQNQQALNRFAGDNGVSFPIAADPDRKAFSMFAHTGVPRTYLVSRDGEICFESIGFWDNKNRELEEKLAKSLAPP